jgi:hypothetical protein
MEQARHAANASLSRQTKATRVAIVGQGVVDAKVLRSRGHPDVRLRKNSSHARTVTSAVDGA